MLRRKAEVALDTQALPAAAREPLDVALSQLDRAAVTITALLRGSAVETNCLITATRLEGGGEHLASGADSRAPTESQIRAQL